jgi:hypothetical protein
MPGHTFAIGHVFVIFHPRGGGYFPSSIFIAIPFASLKAQNGMKPLPLSLF